jgi:hypothetical protein
MPHGRFKGAVCLGVRLRAWLDDGADSIVPERVNKPRIMVGVGIRYHKDINRLVAKGHHLFEARHKGAARTAIDDHLIAIRRFDIDGIALPDIKKCNRQQPLCMNAVTKAEKSE